MQPLVSVCIPAYNNESYIKETIDSILNQTYKNIELIICDDKSKDGTVAVIESIDDNRIILFKNDENLGMSGNWNNCLLKCKGEFIKLICADDILAPNALEKEVEALINNPSAVLAESDTCLFDLEGKKRGWYKRYRKKGLVNGKEISRACMFVKDYFGAPLNNTFRRDVLEKVGLFDTDFVYILDYDYFIRIACQGDVYIIHEPLNYFRIRNDSNTGEVIAGDKTAAYVAEHRMLVNKHREVLGLNNFEVELSVFIRKMRNFIANIYLQIFVRK